jgi:DNA repair exonuclease SbcCD ATPase subunit
MPTLTRLTVQNIEQTLSELTGTWVQQNIHDFTLLKTSILNKEPIPSIITEIHKQLQTLQQQEEERITQHLQTTAIQLQKTNDADEARQDKQEEYSDDVAVIASNIENLRVACASMEQQKEQIKNRQEEARKEKLDTSVKDLINQALLNQIREDETQTDQEQRDAHTDAQLEQDLTEVEQKIAETKIRVNTKTKAVQDRIQELEKQYQDDPKQLKEKKGQSSLDMFNVGNWKNRDEQLQKLRTSETKAKDTLAELKRKKQHLERAIHTRPTREQERQQHDKARKARKKARKAALTHDLISTVLDSLLNRKSEASFILSGDVMQQLSTTHALSLQSKISRARTDLDHECQVTISQALSPLDRDIADRDAKITQLTEQLKGVSGRAEKRRIQAEDRQKRSELRHQYPNPSTTSSDWDVQLTHGIKQTLSDDIARARNNLEKNAKELLSHAQVQSWPILFDCVSHQRPSHEDDNHINTLQKICAHMKAHQQAHDELKQLKPELSTMHVEVASKQNCIHSLRAQIDKNNHQIEEKKLSATNQQEIMPFKQSSVDRSERSYAILRLKMLGYATLLAVSFIIIGVAAAGVLPTTPIASVIFMSLCVITAVASIRNYMKWSTASSLLAQHKNQLTEAQKEMEQENQNISALTRQNDGLGTQIENLKHEVSIINQEIGGTEQFIQQRKHDANRSHYLAQALTPDNPEPTFQEDRASAPILSMFNHNPDKVAVAVAVPVSGDVPVGSVKHVI